VHLEPGLLDSKPRNTIEVISRSFSIIQSNSHQPWRDVTDILIEPEVHKILWDEFVRTPELVAAGAEAAKAALPQIRAALGRREAWTFDGEAQPRSANVVSTSLPSRRRREPLMPPPQEAPPAAHP